MKMLAFCRVAFLACLFFVIMVIMLSGTSIGGVYESKCTGCHGADGKGNPGIAKVMLEGDIKPLDLTKPESKKKSDKDLKAVILNGAGKMAKFSDKISGKEADELVKFVRTLQK